MDDLFEAVIGEVQRMADEIEATTGRQVDYVVLSDLLLGARSVLAMTDSRGQRFLLVAADLLDDLAHDPPATDIGAARTTTLFGIPVHKHEDMPPGWPDQLP